MQKCYKQIYCIPAVYTIIWYILQQCNIYISYRFLTGCYCFVVCMWILASSVHHHHCILIFHLSELQYNTNVIITSAMAKVMFSSLSVALSVWQSVCLSVSNTAEKRLNGFSWNFQGKWDLIQGTVANIFRMFHSNSVNTGIFSHFFGGIYPSQQLCRKTVERIFMKFPEKDGHDTRSNLKHFLDVMVNPLNPGSIYRQTWHKK